MQKINDDLFSFYRFHHLGCFDEIMHFISSGEKSIGFSEITDDGVVRSNRMDLGKSVGFNADQIVCVHQVHSDRVAVVGMEDAGSGAMDKESRLPDTDGLITNVPGICLLVLSADCVPVLLYDPVKQVIGAVHAGWRGTVAGIAGKAVVRMQEVYGSRPEDIVAGIGPSIGKCCFEVGGEVADVFKVNFLNISGILTRAAVSDKYYIDLWSANSQVLTDAGVLQQNIEVSGLCTRCHPGDFFSYRYSGKQAGRFGAGIMLREK